MYMLKVDDIEYPLGTDALASLAGNLPDNSSNALLFAKLACHPAARIRSCIAYKSKIDEATASSLSRDRDLDVLRNIARNEMFRKIATESDLKRLIDIGDSTLCATIAGELEGYENCDPSFVSELLISSSDPLVRLAVAQNYRTPKKILKKLLNDSDPDVQISAKQED